MRTNSASFKIHQYLTKNPNAIVKDVAERFNVAASMVYKIRKDILNTPIKFYNPEPAATVIAPPPASTVIAPIPAATSIDSTLTERGQRYGYFSGHAQVTQELKRVMSRHASSLDKTFTDSQWEALEMIAHKIGRIVNGDPDHADSWVDIAGYAKLVADQLQGIDR